jgi:(2R)-3-sulfolactate dehydrogenase (NADP+)
MSVAHLQRNDLEALVAHALVASRTQPTIAASVACALVQAEIDGQKGHGLSRVPSYAAQAKSGKVDGNAEPGWLQTRTGTALVDVRSGFAYPAFDLAIAELPKLAEASGIAAAGFVRSHHAGVLGWHMERLADHGLIAIAFANTPQAMTAWGGAKPLFGTNPIAFAAPRASGAPLVIDLALSLVARGKIQTAAQKGEPIPSDWAFDATGAPTTDAAAAMAGTLAPMGGAKGAALALMVELLAAALTGAKFANEATSFFDGDGTPPGVGQLFLAISPDAFAGRQRVLERIETLAGAIENDGGARLPGTRRLANRAKAAQNGIAVDAATMQTLQRLAEAGNA